MDLSEARRQAEAQWTANPCGATGGDPATLDYFLEVERDRYRQQSWQQAYFWFNRFADKRVLEIGVGQGTDLVQFAKAGAVCHGVDITDAHLELARRNLALRGLAADLRKSDATALPFHDAHFDAVYSFGVVHHIPDVEAVVREIRRVLKPGGELMLAVYRRWSFFHLFWVIVRGLLQGRLFRLGYDGLLSTIEAGADGVAIKPYVKLYSTREVRELLAGFDLVDVSVRHLYLGRRERAWLRPLLDRLEQLLGWYVVARAVKK